MLGLPSCSFAPGTVRTGGLSRSQPHLTGFLSTLSSHVGQDQVTFTQAGMPHLSPNWEEGRGGVLGFIFRGATGKLTSQAQGKILFPWSYTHTHRTRENGDISPHALGQGVLRSSGLLHNPLGPSDQAPPSTCPKPPQEKSRRTLNLRNLYNYHLD